MAERAHPALPMFRRHRYGLIDNAAVAAAYRGRGLGQALFSATVEWLRGRGITAAQVQVWSENEGACRFYQRQGFKPITTRMELDI